MGNSRPPKHCGLYNIARGKCSFRHRELHLAFIRIRSILSNSYFGLKVAIRGYSMPGSRTVFKAVHFAWGDN